MTATAINGRISKEGLAKTTLELVEFDTTNPPGDTRDIVQWIETRFGEHGIPIERVESDPLKPNIIATIAGERDEKLLFSGHLDTVPFDPDGWSYDPFGERDGNRLYGRGTADMKGAIAAMIHVAEAFSTADGKPPVTLEFAFVSDEEVGGEAGVKALLETDRLDADGCVIGEPTCSGGMHSMTIADRGSIWITLEATGKAAHGSRPMLGENAIDRLWNALETIRNRLDEQILDIPRNVDPVVTESVEYYSPTMGADVAQRLFERPTANLGTVLGGENVNSVPRSARAELDVRLTAGVDTASILADIRNWLEPLDSVTMTDVSWSNGTYEEMDSPLVRSLASVGEAVLDDRIYRRSATGGGDAKRLRNAGIPTVEFAVSTATPHACDEFTTVEALVATADVYGRLPEAVNDEW